MLYGPNDLGKSTLADAIRLVLLLPIRQPIANVRALDRWPVPHGRADVPTDAQRLARASSSKAGSSVLEESRDGQQFDEVERARRVDARLRRSCAGESRAGRLGAAKGLPTSFGHRVAVHTGRRQRDLEGSLERDTAPTGKERIAAALQALAQDPLFVGLLREVQSNETQPTRTGCQEDGAGSVFKVAADRLKAARGEGALAEGVHDSEGVESQLRDLCRSVSSIRRT